MKSMTLFSSLPDKQVENTPLDTILTKCLQEIIKLPEFEELPYTELVVNPLYRL